MTKTDPTVIHRGKIIYVLYPEKVVVGVGGDQWVSYNQYDNWNRQGITKFRKAIEKSEKDEYTTAVELMTLAHDCEIRGTGTSRPRGIDL